MKNNSEFTKDYTWINFSINVESKDVHLAFDKLKYFSKSLSKFDIEGFMIEPRGCKGRDIAISVFAKAIYTTDIQEELKAKLNALLCNITLLSTNKIELNEVIHHTPSYILDYTIDFPGQNEQSGIGLHSALSLIIADALSKETISNEIETLVTVGYYFHVHLIKMILTTYSRPLDSHLLHLYNINYTALPLKKKVSIVAKLAENEKDLYEIKLNVFNDKTPDSTKWSGKVDHLLKTMLDFIDWNKSEEKNIMNQIGKIISVINRRLRLDQNAVLILNSFVTHSFSNYYLNRQKFEQNVGLQKDLDAWSIENVVIQMINEKIPLGLDILEFGSGEGTSELMKSHIITSIEHDPTFLEYRGAGHRCYYAPLENGWYRKATIKEVLGEIHYEMILVDGPPANTRGNLINHLDLLDDYIGYVVFDDVNRKNDYDLCDKFCSMMGYQYKIYSGKEKKFAWCQKKETIPSSTIPANGYC